MLRLFKGHVVSCKGILYMLESYCSCKDTLHCSKGRLHLLTRACCISVLNTAFVGSYRYVVIMLKTSAEIVFC